MAKADRETRRIKSILSQFNALGKPYSYYPPPPKIQREEDERKNREKTARLEALRQAKEERERTGGPLAKLAETEERLRVQKAQEEEEGARKGIWLRFKEYNDRRKRDIEYNKRAGGLMTDEQKRMSSDRAWDYRKQQAFNLAAGAAGLGWGAAKGVVKAGAGMVDYGYDKAKNADKGTIWLIFAIVIALIDIFLGEKYHGYRFTLSGFVNINILGIITSTLFLGFAIFRIGWDIIDRHLSFFMIVLIYMIIKFSGAKIMEFRINALYVSIAFWLIMLIFILFKLRGNDMSIFLQEDVAFMIFIFVLAYFWWQPGWQNESKTWLHFGFILLFGSFFMRTHEQKKSWWYYLTIILLLFDFYGYSLLMDFAGLDYIFSLFPPLLVFVGGYISYRAENQLALIFVLVFAGLMFFFAPAQAFGGGDIGIGVEKEPGKTPAEIAKRFTEAIKQWSNRQLELATGGLYKGRVEENQYEKLGLYLDKVRASEPRYYTEEPVTLWGTIKARTLSDAVIVNVTCNKWTVDNKRVYASKVEPTNFSIFNLEERDVECTFDPTKGDDAQRNVQRFPAGTHIVTMSAGYNFATDAYLKSYYIDRDRYRAMIREELDPFQEFGITDKKPIAVYTNGPVEIGMDLTPLIAVERTSVPSPALSITLNNRGKVIGQEGKILGEWEGRIKGINELVVLLPNGVQMEDPNVLDGGTKIIKCGDRNFKRYNHTDCEKSCETYVLNPCKEMCSGISNTDDKKSCEDECTKSEDKCKKDCDIFFKDDSDANKEYNGYSLITEDIRYMDDLKDIDRFRTFTCRIYPTKDVLGTTPITTRFIRARARYSYTLEKSVVIPVEMAPGSVSVDFTGIFLDEAGKTDVPPILPMAIALQESGQKPKLGYRHCCRDAGKNTAGDCVFTSDQSCGDDRILTSPAGSIGIMQINKNVHSNRTSKICGKDGTLNNLECNIKVGVDILKEYYNLYKGGIPKATLESNCKDQTYVEKYLKYRGWQAALRAYNGLGCAKNADLDYVEDVIGNACDIMRGIVKPDEPNQFPENFLEKFNITTDENRLICP